MSQGTKVLGRPGERVEAAPKKSTATSLPSRLLELTKQVNDLENDNKRLRQMLAQQRKLWSVRLLDPLGTTSRKLVVNRLCTLITEHQKRDLEFAQWLMSKRNGPVAPRGGSRG